VAREEGREELSEVDPEEFVTRVVACSSTGRSPNN
jgi:hypothetical protein